MSLGAQPVKNPPGVQATWVRSLGREDPLEKEVVPTPVFLSRAFPGQRSLVGYSPWGCKELDTTERLLLPSRFAGVNLGSGRSRVLRAESGHCPGGGPAAARALSHPWLHSLALLRPSPWIPLGASHLGGPGAPPCEAPPPLP